VTRYTRLLSLLFAAAPFGFALIRAVSTRSDLRLLWMACASFLGAMAVRAIGTAGSRMSGALVPSIVTFAVTTLLAAATVMMLGATSAAGIWGMATVLGLCWAASCALDIRSRT
jgi:hypothetical protein